MSDDVRDPRAADLVPQQQGPMDGELRAFLIADVRGYTSFTQRHGDEAAAKLAAKFARVAREVVEQHRGNVLELRGDEALCVFTSPRQAVRAAVALQRRFVQETRWERDLPLPVGVGVDIGEAVPVEGGYRSGALNLASRLCAIARPGEILATAEVTHLARRMEGLSYVAKEAVRLKGLAEPVRPVRVLPDGEDPVAQLAALGALPPTAPVPASPRWLPGPMRGRRWLTAVAVLAVLAVVATVLATVIGRSATPLASLGEDVVGIVDPSSAKLVAETPVGASPAAVAYGGGSVWVANADDGTVSRVDRSTRRVVQTVDVGSAPTSVAVADGSVWVANSASGTVSRIDLRSGRIVGTVAVGSVPAGLAVDGGRIWVVDTTGGAVWWIDPATDAARLLVRLGVGLAGIAASDNHVWVSDSLAGTVTEIDEPGGRVAQTVHVGSSPGPLSVVGDDVWVANNLDGTVSRISTRTGNVVATLPVGDRPDAVTSMAGAVWVASADGLTRIDPQHNRVAATVRTASAPTGIAVVDGSLWVSAAVNPALHRGGTMATSVPDPPHLDPAVGYEPQSEPYLAVLFDGLLTFRRASGAAGGTIVPDLAQALPTITDDGRTYSFRLRAGIRWSDGRPLTGADIRRGLERTVAAQVWPLYGGIVGAAQCTRHVCDLSRGVVVDDTARTVTIRLAAPDSEFLYKIATLGAVAVPASTPLAAPSARPLPSTGPYAVQTATPRSLVLVRNRFFHEWSPAAQPAGFPDRIVATVRPENTPAPLRQLASVDWAVTRFVPDLAALHARFGTRLHLTPQLGTHFLFLNTRRPPFDDVRARRAVAYALDRAAIAADFFRPVISTCQMLPPTIPGYRPYCPFTLRPDSRGQWQAPDLAKAQHLVRAAGVDGMGVEMDVPTSFVAMRHVVDALRAIGFHVKWNQLPLATFQEKEYRLAAKNRAQVGYDAWGADYPAASNFIETQLTCAQDVRATPTGNNLSRFCSSPFDRQVTAAERLQASDPGAAAASWTRLDREITDTAAMIPIANGVDVDVVSTRLHHFERNSVIGPLFDQAWLH